MHRPVSAAERSAERLYDFAYRSILALPASGQCAVALRNVRRPLLHCTEKREHMGLLFSDDDLDAMKRLRAVFDPTLACNPGKLFPTTRFCFESNPNARGYDQVPLG